jgi:hypothetical protein
VRPAARILGETEVRNQFRLAIVAAACFLTSNAYAGNDQGFGRCKDGFADNTMVRTESRGDLTIGQVQVSDRVWSFNEIVGKPGWSRVLQRVDGGQHYKLLSEFSEPGSAQVTKACWRIKRAP